VTVDSDRAFRDYKAVSVMAKRSPLKLLTCNDACVTSTFA